MKAGLLNWIAFLFTVLVLSACSIGRITISVLEPAMIAIPSEISRVSLFPGAGIPDPPGVIDSISKIQLDPENNYNRLKRGYVEGIYESLSASPRFKKIVKSDTTYEFLLSTGQISWDELRALCRSDSTDAVLILKRAVSYDLLQMYTAPGIPCGITYQMINRTKWSFFQPFLHQESGNMVFSDTIVFDQGKVDCFSPYKMEHIPDLLYESFFNTGLRIGRWISPSWRDSIPRIFFTGPGNDLRSAARLAMNDQWHQAAAIWNRLAEGNKKKIVSHASFNLALAWERDDELDQALLWIRYADSLYSSGSSISYRKILEDRVKSRDLLDQQMKGN